MILHFSHMGFTEGLTHLNRDFVAGKDTDKVHPELSGNVGQDDMASANIHLEHGVRQGFYHRAFEFDYIVFCQSFIPPDLNQMSSAMVRISASPSVMRMVFS